MKISVSRKIQLDLLIKSAMTAEYITIKKCLNHALHIETLKYKNKSLVPRKRITLKKDLASAKSFLVGEDGFEPSKHKAADLQSVPFGHSGTLPYLIHAEIHLRKNGAGGRT